MTRKLTLAALAVVLAGAAHAAGPPDPIMLRQAGQDLVLGDFTGIGAVVKLKGDVTKLEQPAKALARWMTQFPTLFPPGSDTARFGRFLKSPAAAFRHLARLHRREPDTEVGHNAAGGWMVVVMLVLLCVQVGTGLCANDQVSVEGPLAHVVGSDNSDWLSHVHAVNFRLIEAAVALHLLAILTYRVLRKHRLVWPMITGSKPLPDTLPAPRMASPVKAFAALCVSAGLVAFVVLWFGD